MAQPFAQDNTDKIPLVSADKAQFIHHVNEEHQDELAMFINAFTTTSISDDAIVSIVELYLDGMLLEITTINNNNNVNALQDNSTHNQTNDAGLPSLSRQYFIAFTDPISESISLQEQYIILLQAAAKKLGKRTIKLQEQLFTVLDGYYASPNMYRLVVTAPDNAPLNHAGYGYLFELDSALNSVSIKRNDSDDNDGDKFLQRYYTLRKAWQESNNSPIRAWIDIYIHGNTEGGNWARALDSGMQIKSVREYPEKTEHLTDGQCLLICDETSLPTVANLLENWQNPLPPLVIVIINDADDVSYIHNLDLSEQLRRDKDFMAENLYHIINKPTVDLTEQIMEVLNAQLASLPVTIAKVWGALEATNTKSLRQQLKSTLGLSRQDMVLKVYWRAQ